MDLFLQLPLSTLIYLIEADNLEDLIWLLLRLGVQISHYGDIKIVQQRISPEIITGPLHFQYPRPTLMR